MTQIKLFLVLLGCTWLSATAQTETHVRKISVTSFLPSDTDPLINSFSGNGYNDVAFLSDTGAKRNRLFVWLPGTRGNGSGAHFINETAAELGYHVINLVYPNDLAMVELCKAGNDPMCYDNTRKETIFGDDMSDLLVVDKANSIVNRLGKAIAYLNRIQPGRGWGQFLKNGQVNWGRVVISGASQGGGHAALIAKLFKVARVVMYAAPKDFGTQRNVAAPWISIKSKTPPGRYFAFVHSEDNVACSFKEQVQILQLLGMEKFGALTDVDHSTHFSTHMLTSSRPQANPHTSVVGDTSYINVWRYMLKAPVR